MQNVLNHVSDWLPHLTGKCRKILKKFSDFVDWPTSSHAGFNYCTFGLWQLLHTALGYSVIHDIFVLFAFAEVGALSSDISVPDQSLVLLHILHINLVSLQTFGLRLKFETLVSAKHKVTQCRADAAPALYIVKINRNRTISIEAWEEKECLQMSPESELRWFSLDGWWQTVLCPIVYCILCDICQSSQLCK